MGGENCLSFLKGGAIQFSCSCQFLSEKFPQFARLTKLLGLLSVQLSSY